MKIVLYKIRYSANKKRVKFCETVYNNADVLGSFERSQLNVEVAMIWIETVGYMTGMILRRVQVQGWRRAVV